VEVRYPETPREHVWSKKYRRYQKNRVADPPAGLRIRAIEAKSSLEVDILHEEFETSEEDVTPIKVVYPDDNKNGPSAGTPRPTKGAPLSSYLLTLLGRFFDHELTIW
jgi:hypothetical protein